MINSSLLVIHFGMDLRANKTQGNIYRGCLQSLERDTRRDNFPKRSTGCYFIDNDACDCHSSCGQHANEAYTKWTELEKQGKLK